MKNLSFILLCVLFFAACESSDDLATPSSRISERSQQTRYFSASLSSAIDVNSPPTACTGDLPGLAVVDYFMSGTATHLGNLNVELSTLHHISCDLSFATMLLTTSVSGQLVSANGDVIYYTGDDVIDVFNLLTGSGTTGSINGTWTVNGGTGRFEDATGSFTISGLVDFTTLTFTAEAVGTITY